MRLLDRAVLDQAAQDLDRDGVAIVPGVLTSDEAAEANERLWAASRKSAELGNPLFIEGLDPNASNVRVFNLLDLDPLFVDLIFHPTAEAIVGNLLGTEFIVSNFSANIARPGSKSMAVHSDLSFVMPEPWLAPASVNVVWCLTDVYPENGATLHIPGSQRYQTLADVPEDPISHMVPFEAKAGSLVVMEGRVWHTSGANVTNDVDRALLFGYYTKPFLRPQFNFTAALAAELQASMNPAQRYRLGLDPSLNVQAVKVIESEINQRA